MRLTVVQGDLTVQRVDAVVNAANRAMRGGGGVDTLTATDTRVEEARLVAYDAPTYAAIGAVIDGRGLPR